MATYDTAQAAFDELQKNPSKYKTLESLKKLASEVSSHSGGKVTVLYSGADDDILAAIKANPDARMIGKTPASEFLGDDRFIKAVASVMKQPIQNYNIRNTPLNEIFNGTRDGDFWNELSRRFVQETKGPTFSVTNTAPDNRIWAKTELFEALDNAYIPELEGIPKDRLIQARNDLVQTGKYATADDATDAIRAKISTQADHNIRSSQIGFDAEGKPVWFETSKFTNGVLTDAPKTKVVTLESAAENLDTKIQKALASDDINVRERALKIQAITPNNLRLNAENTDALRTLPHSPTRQAAIDAMAHQGSTRGIYREDLHPSQKLNAIDSPNPIVQNLRANGASEELIEHALNAKPRVPQPDTPFHTAHKQTQLNPNEPEVTRAKRPIEYGPPLGMSTYNDFVHEESIKQAAESKVINQSVVQAQAQTDERLKAVSDEIKASRVSNLGVQGVGAVATAFDVYTGYQEIQAVKDNQATFKEQVETVVIEGGNRVGRGITAGSGAVVGGAAASEIPVIGTIAGGMAGYEAAGRFYDAKVAPVVKSALKPVAETVYQYGTEQGRTENKISDLQSQISQTTGLEQQNLQEQLKRTSRDYSKVYSANQNEIDARHHNNATINEFQLNNARTQIDNDAVNSRIADKTAAGQSVAQAVTSSRSEVLNERKTADESIYRQLSPQQQASIDKTLSQYNTSFTNAYTLMTWDEARKNLSPNADEFYNRTLAQIKQDDLAVRGNVKDPRDIQIQQAEQAKAAELAREQQREASRPNPNAHKAIEKDQQYHHYTPPKPYNQSENERLQGKSWSDASDYAPAAASVALASANRMDSGHYGDTLDNFNQTRSPNFEGVLKAQTTALVEKPTDVQHASMYTEPQSAQPIALPHNLAVLREKLVEKFGNQLDHLSEKDQQTTIALATLEAAKFHVRTVDQIFISPKGDVLMSFDQQRTCSADINLAQVPNYDANQVLAETINLQQSQQQALAQRQSQSQSGPTMTL